MKLRNILIAIILVVGVPTLISATRDNSAIENVEMKGSTFKLVNDTDEKVKVHTGSGEVSLNANGGSTSVSCTSGKDVKVNGKKIFTISEDLCGEVVKLSKYM